MKSDMRVRGSERALRRDAAENRQRLLDAAATVFSERGLDVGVDEIARVAGVGIGTLYRRFPTKDALVSELVRQVYDDFLALADEALSAPDGEGLEQVLYGTGAILASNRGCLSRMWNDDETTILRDEYRRILFELLARAKQHGASARMPPTPTWISSSGPCAASSRQPAASPTQGGAGPWRS